MKPREILIVIACLFSLLSVNSQNQASLPEGLYDKDGVFYPMNSFSLNTGSGNNQISAPQVCTAGYFEIYFMPNSGFDQNSTLHQQRRNVLCQVMTDVSNFIISPLTSNMDPNTNKVKVMVGTFSGGSQVLGYASPFFMGYLSKHQWDWDDRILDNAVWLTINTGFDIYKKTVTSTYAPAFAFPGDAPHGMMAYNFNAVNYNYNLGSPPNPNETDFYSVVLHEATHMLGFFSLINVQGRSGLASQAGSNAKLFSRFDLRVHSTQSTAYKPAIINGMQPCGPINYVQYNAAQVPTTQISQLGVTCNVAPPLNCNVAMNYCGSTYTIPLFTGACFQMGTQLSHIEPTCVPGNPQYVMTGGLPQGIMRREYLKEEVSILCDIGYNVNTTFGNTNSLNYVANYPSNNCQPIPIGVNDGASTTSTLQYVTNLGSPFTFFPLQNDIGASTYTCLNIMTGAGVISSNNGTSFVYTPSLPGIHKLSYIPLNSSGTKGNITEIFIFVRDNCQSPCDIVTNGSFEAGSGCGLRLDARLGTTNPQLQQAYPTINCWEFIRGANFKVTRNCFWGPSWQAGAGLPDTRTGVNTGNDNYVRIQVHDMIQAQLAQPIVPNGTYQVNYYINPEISSFNPPNISNISILLSDRPNFHRSNEMVDINNLPATYTLMNSFTGQIPVNVWTPVSFTFNYTGQTNANYLVVLNHGMGGDMIIFFDELSVNRILPNMSPSLSIPSSFCQGDIYQNLNSSITPSNSLSQNGFFTGPGVINNNGNWEINTTSVPSGVYLYTYAYTSTISGCTYSVSSTATIFPRPALTVVATGTNGNCINQFSPSATLTANSGTSTIQYNWMPGNLTGSTVIVSPTVTTIYTISAFDGTCTSITNYTVNVVPNLGFTNTPFYWCTNTHILPLEQYLTPSTPLTGTWSILPAIPIQTTNIGQHWLSLNPTHLPGTYTLYYSLMVPNSTCSTSIQFTVDVIKTPTVSTNGTINHCSNLAGYASTLVATSNPSNQFITYSWMPGNLTGASPTVIPTGPTNYTLTATNGSCGIQTATAQINFRNDCCGTYTSQTAFNFLNTSILGTQTLSGLYAINQDVTVTGTTVLNGEYYLASDVKITIAPGGLLTTANPNYSIHLLGCTAMWDGIKVQSHGRIELKNYDFIEDAKIAIESDNSQVGTNNPAFFDIYLEDVLFNKNNVAVSIKNYTIANGASPFQIGGCIFTCRNLPYQSMVNSSSASWPSANSLKTSIPSSIHPCASPYNLGYYLPTSLLTTSVGPFSNAGVLIEKSGMTLNANANTPNYYSIIIGDQVNAQPKYNFFDNLLYGITSINSNLYTYGNIIQNTRLHNPFGSIYIYGYGIRAENNNTYLANKNSYIGITSPVNPTLNPNYFYNCHYAIYTSGLFQVDIQGAQIRSTHASNQNSNPASTGRYGIWLFSNKFKDYQIKDNKIINVSNGISLYAYPSSLAVGTATYGQLWGGVNIVSNTITPLDPQVLIATLGEYVDNAIQIDHVLMGTTPQTLSPTVYTVAPNLGIRVQQNFIQLSRRGVLVRNHNVGVIPKLISNNVISLASDPNNNQQYGVSVVNSYATPVNTNTITGCGFNGNSNVAGTYFSMNVNCGVQCNSTSNAPKCHQFAGYNQGTVWRYNSMQPSPNGLLLSNNGIIGQQGTFNSPQDNVWTGNWNGSLYNTWVDMNSLASNSKLYRRTITNSNPQNNSGGNPNDYSSFGNLIQANNSSPSASCNANINNGPNSPKVASAKLVATGAAAYSGNTLTTTEIDSKLLYDYLCQDSLYRSCSLSIDSFFISKQGTNVSQLKQIETWLGEGNTMQAQNLLNSMVVSTSIEANYVSYYNLYIQYANGSFGNLPNDTLQLMQLAAKCPFIDGTIVYNARSLYDLITGEVHYYADEMCDVENGSSEKRMNTFTPEQITSNLVEEYFVYPNPTQGDLVVLSPNENESIEVNLFDVAGRLVVKEQINVSDGRANLSALLERGVYTLQLKVNGTVVYRRKHIFN